MALVTVKFFRAISIEVVRQVMTALFFALLVVKQFAIVRRNLYRSASLRRPRRKVATASIAESPPDDGHYFARDSCQLAVAVLNSGRLLLVRIPETLGWRGIYSARLPPS